MDSGVVVRMYLFVYLYLEEAMNHLHELIELVKHPAIQSRRWEWQVGDMYCCPRQAESNGDGIKLIGSEDYTDIADQAHIIFEPCCPDVAIWIPKLSDPIQPERGLIGLCKGLTTIGSPVMKDNWFVMVRVVNSDGEYVRFDTFKGPTPEIAVAKAVIAQVVVPTGNGNHGQAVIRIQDNGLNGKRKKPPPVHGGGEIRQIFGRDLLHRLRS